MLICTCKLHGMTMTSQGQHPEHIPIFHTWLSINRCVTNDKIMILLELYSIMILAFRNKKVKDNHPLVSYIKLHIGG